MANLLALKQPLSIFHSRLGVLAKKTPIANKLRSHPGIPSLDLIGVENVKTPTEINLREVTRLHVKEPPQSSTVPKLLSLNATKRTRSNFQINCVFHPTKPTSIAPTTQRLR
jgi:hypothetical protein